MTSSVSKLLVRSREPTEDELRMQVSIVMGLVVKRRASTNFVLSGIIAENLVYI